MRRSESLLSGLKDAANSLKKNWSREAENSLSASSDPALVIGSVMFPAGIRLLETGPGGYQGITCLERV